MCKDTHKSKFQITLIQTDMLLINTSNEIDPFVQGYSHSDYIDSNSHNLATKSHATAKSIKRYNTVGLMIPTF